ncbi:hypothetical protein QBC38DRAFT_485838 [Podospora fimiseda]|uniref:Fucose-specific lectin n=1 Tax=Podospora fimiseda TaxID=252190 RepID=A0AAN7BIS3_9PEZI|nr:hypothetical protein QBC38DRAFT_485838 [Podospora fimiseda]
MATNSIKQPLWAVVLLLPTLSSCGSMAAWWTDIGPSFVLQNASTGLLTHSLCHSNNTPLYPTDPPVAFKTKYAPKNGTSLTATGWYDTMTTWASLFYQNNNDDIVNAVYKCNFETGTYEEIESDVISDRSGTPPPNAQTGLSVALLGQQEGYRVFYHDRARALHTLKFTQVENWSYGNPISTSTNRSGLALGSMFSGVRNVTVVTPKDVANIETIRLNIDNAWHITTFPTPLRGSNVTNLSNLTSLPYDTSSPPPFSLQGWDGNPKAIGIAIDTVLTRHIFYIGTDKAVHSYAAFVTGLTESGFRAQPDQSNEYWPLADEPNSDFAIASHLGSSTIRLYYLSGGQLIEAKYKNGNWDPASRLVVANTTVFTNNTGPVEEDNGLSTGAKAGIGVGVTVGALLLITGGVAAWILRKKKSTTSDVEAHGDEGASTTAGGAMGATQPASTAQSPDVASQHAEIARTGSGLSTEKWDTDVKDMALTPPPRELESPNLASELPQGIDRNELPTKHHITELP